MNDSTKSEQSGKSPLILLFLVAVLVIATLVVASNYFLRPQLETELRKEITHSFSQVGLGDTKIELSGRDVILNGAVSSKAENATKEIWGIRQVDNQIIIKE